MTRDEEVREVVAELDALLAQLQANVDALNAVLGQRAPSGGAPEKKEPVT